jgi:hypothetical protein
MAKLLKTLEVCRDEVWCHDINLYEITSCPAMLINHLQKAIWFLQSSLSQG